MSFFTELRKRHLLAAFTDSVRYNPKQCKYPFEKVTHAFEQAQGIMQAYGDEMYLSQGDDYLRAKWDYYLRWSAKGLAERGPEAFLYRWRSSINSNHDDMTWNFPLIKGLESFAALMGIPPDKDIRKIIDDFEKYREEKKLRRRDQSEPVTGMEFAYVV